ncbi:MAG: hypothetical protein GKR88_08455 [Flavobacteriaceae bacterium]|nr:MAG: hypothetical protein GKR88_08455 [Flavobacteriaceae bacterium]
MKYTMIILLSFCGNLFGQINKTKDTIILKFDANQKFMYKHVFFNPLIVNKTKDSASIIYRYTKPLKKTVSNPKTKVLFHLSFLVQAKKEIVHMRNKMYRYKVLKKDITYLENRLVLNYNFFKNNDEKYIRDFIFRKERTILIYDISEPKENGKIVLREVGSFPYEEI